MESSLRPSSDALRIGKHIRLSRRPSSMPIPSTCPGCKATVNLPDAFLGKRVRCKKCQTIYVVAGKTGNAMVDEEPVELELVRRAPLLKAQAGKARAGPAHDTDD